MKLPAMNVIKRKSEGVNRFSGLDQRPKPYSSAFASMKNMTCERLPVMAARKPRMRVRTLRHPGGIFAHGKLCWVENKGFYFDGVRKGDVLEGEKQFVRMGAYVLIWPDCAYYNTMTDEFGSLNRHNETAGMVTGALCNLNGGEYEYTTGETAPQNPQNGQYWMDTSQTPNVLKMWYATGGMWTSVPTVYTKISNQGIGKGLKPGDAVTLSGFIEATELNGMYTLTDCADNYIVVVALIQKAFEQRQTVVIDRKAPEMDYVTEAGNRVWGCSNARHELYACALGDPTNWTKYQGAASDSYAVTVGTAGDFTGAATHMNYPVFFKEDVVHQVMGNAPSNFALTTNTCRGVAKGSAKSLVHVNEYLLYHAPLDVCIMGNSTLPSTVSELLGKKTYANAIAGASGSRYMMSAENERGQRELLVYDTQNNSWCREDDAEVMQFANADGVLYMLYRNGEIWAVDGEAPENLKDETAAAEKLVEWELVTGPLGMDEAYSKWISGIQIHVACELGSAIRMDVAYNEETEWREVFRLDPVKTRSLTIPLIPRRCRTMRLRLRGVGAFELYLITKTIEQGSDVYAVD